MKTRGGDGCGDRGLTMTYTYFLPSPAGCILFPSCWVTNLGHPPIYHLYVARPMKAPTHYHQQITNEAKPSILSPVSPTVPDQYSTPPSLLSGNACLPCLSHHAINTTRKSKLLFVWGRGSFFDSLICSSVEGVIVVFFLYEVCQLTGR